MPGIGTVQHVVPIPVSWWLPVCLLALRAHAQLRVVVRRHDGAFTRPQAQTCNAIEHLHHLNDHQAAADALWVTAMHIIELFFAANTQAALQWQKAGADIQKVGFRRKRQVTCSTSFSPAHAAEASAFGAWSECSQPRVVLLVATLRTGRTCAHTLRCMMIMPAGWLQMPHLAPSQASRWLFV